jgi:prepilin-type N-terminal cleavage/methylation domain-containing protein
MDSCGLPRRRRGFTLIELMVAIAILLALGLMVIAFLRNALDMTRTATARGDVYETAQTTLRLLERDLSQVLGPPPHAAGLLSDLSFVVMTDPHGRQMLAFTRAWGEERTSPAGYDAGRAHAAQGWGADFTGRNVQAAMRASGGALEVVYVMEPLATATRLYRAAASPPRVGGLIDSMIAWCLDFQGAADDLVPLAALIELNLDGQSLWEQFELVADNVLGLGIECWDDWEGTTTWHSSREGPVTEWSISRRMDERPSSYALPRALALTLLLNARDPMRVESFLSSEASERENALFLDDARRFPDVVGGSAIVRVNSELIAYGSRFGRTLGGCARGVLGTRARSHAAGSIVTGGEAFRRVIQLPVTR